MSWDSLITKCGLSKMNRAVFLSILIALSLSVIPIPLSVTPFWPEWVLLAVIYWCVALPDRYNVGFAWLCGFAMDIVHGDIIGQHMLSYVVVVTLAVLLHHRLRLYPVWQQALIVGMLLIPYFLLTLWIHHFLYATQADWRYWTPLLGSLVAWPWVFSVLRFARYKASHSS